MMNLLRTFLLSFVFAAVVCPSAFCEGIEEGDVVVVPLSGEVNPAQAIFLRRILKEAETAKAGAFIIDMDTPGGRLDAAVDILQLLLKANIPTYTWVNDDAGSAGALIALGSDHIYMAPVSAIGAAAPVSGEGMDLAETMKSKVVSYFSGYFRSAAEAKGRNPELAEAFIDSEKEFKVGDEVISPAGSLLTLSAQEATRKFDDKPLLADGIAGSVEQLKSEAKLTGPTVVIEPSGFERLALWITTLAPFLMFAGIAAAYLEFKTPGFGVAGVVSILCFAIYFFGHYIAGLTGFETPAVFLLGALLVLVEVLFFPGVMFVAALGVALMLGALLFAMIDQFPGEPVIPSAEAFAVPALNLALAIALSVIAIALLSRFFPNLPIFRRLILATSSPSGASLTTGHDSQPAIRAGDRGVAHTALRPAGKALIGSTLVDVVTTGDFLPAETPVVICTVEGNRVVVEQAVEEEARASGPSENGRHQTA